MYKILNPCGHIPESPRLAERPQHKPRPKIIESLIQFIRTKVYFDYKHFLPDLDRNEKGRRKSDRSRRSELLEAACSLLEVISHFTCLATFRISKGFNSNQYIPLSLVELASYAKLPLWRASRAMNALIEAGYIEQIERKTPKSKGGYFSLNALRRVTRKLFLHLGITNLSIERSRHWKVKSEEMDKYKSQKLFLELTSGKKQATPARPIELNTREMIDLQIDIEAAEMTKLLQEKYPDMTFNQVWKLAEKNNLPTLAFLRLPRPEPPS